MATVQADHGHPAPCTLCQQPIARAHLELVGHGGHDLVQLALGLLGGRQARGAARARDRALRGLAVRRYARAEPAAAAVAAPAAYSP